MIKGLDGKLIEYTSMHMEPCDGCQTSIKCYQTEDGGIITHKEGKGFHLWAAFGMCTKCNNELEIRLKEFTHQFEMGEEPF
jgi:hypothetical protein